MEGNERAVMDKSPINGVLEEAIQVLASHIQGISECEFSINNSLDRIAVQEEELDMDKKVGEAKSKSPETILEKIHHLSDRASNIKYKLQEDVNKLAELVG